MARGRARAKFYGAPARSSLSVVCVSALLCLAVFTIICGRLLDVGDFQLRFGSPQIDRHTGKFFIPFSNDLQDPRDTPVRPGNSTFIPFGKELLDLRDIPRKGDSTIKHVWESRSAEFYYGCSAASSHFAPSSSFVVNGYITIQASGGLNQQRTGITDSVVVARILNATLVVPELDHTSFWQDSSNFGDIFDVEHFISVVAPDVRVVKELPTHGENTLSAYGVRVPRKSPPQYYEKNVLPKLLSKQVLKLTKFDYRLANKLEEDLQKLRCRVNFEALRFTQPIALMGQQLVERIRRKGGRYIALHLRFEPDMLAFSGCYYGGGPQEIQELGKIRKRWKNLPALDSDKARRNGKCPLSPTEVGLLLRASGFGDDAHLYVASGEVYGGEGALAPLKALFPNFYTKDSLTVDDELKPFQSFSSRMAAIDYIVCDESDVFVANNNGNMARILAGHRRFSGHKRTIRPNAKKLSPLYLVRKELGWEQFAEKVRHVQKGFMGDPYEGNAGRGDFHENPAACICKIGGHSALKQAPQTKQTSKQQGKSGAGETALDVKWPEFEDYFDADGENVKVDSEDNVVRTAFIGEEVWEAGKEDAKLEAKLEETEAQEIPFLSD